MKLKKSIQFLEKLNYYFFFYSLCININYLSADEKNIEGNFIELKF